MTEPDGPRRAGGGGAALGLLVLVAGVVWLLETTDAVDLDFGVWVALLLVGTGLLVLLTRGAARAILVAAGIVLALVAITGAATNVDLSGGIGERRERPAAVADLDDPYELGIGSLRIDLRRLEGDGDVRVRARIGIGELRVVPPQGWTVELDAELGVGDIDFLGEHASGTGPELRRRAEGDPGEPTVTLDLEGGIGAIKVLREGAF
jgi:hypothetical protein